jgi:hypothetical protein
MLRSDLIPLDAPALCNAPDLAAWFRVTRKTIHTWVKLGILPEPARISCRTWWFDTNEVRAKLNGGKVHPADKPRRNPHAS